MSPWSGLTQGAADAQQGDIRISKHHMRYGSGDPYDEPEYRDDVEGEFFYIIGFGSTVERGEFVTWSGALVSLEEAVEEAEKATHGSVVWKR